jgi:hypothetical protein
MSHPSDSAFARVVVRAIARENVNQQGLPPEIMKGMEDDILANPEKYPAVYKLLTGRDA